MKATAAKTIFLGLINSFNNIKNVGFSARKLTAFAFVCCGVYANNKIFNFTQISDYLAITVLVCDIVAAAFFLGLISFTQILELKNGSAKAPKNENN